MRINRASNLFRLPQHRVFLVASALSMAACSSAPSNSALTTSSLGPPAAQRHFVQPPPSAAPARTAARRAPQNVWNGNTDRARSGAAIETGAVGGSSAPAKPAVAPISWRASPRAVPPAQSASATAIGKPKPGPVTTAGQRTIVVASGDTLYSLAHKHQVPVAQLASVNGLTTEKIAVSQKLVLPATAR